jgi:hypothetical protein
MAAAGAAFALALGVGSVGHASVKVVDGVQLQSGGTFILKLATDETHEFFDSIEAFPAPAGFTDATIYLTEPPHGHVGEGPPLPGPPGSTGLAISDVFTLVNNPTTGQVSAYFASDGASADEIGLLVTSPNFFVSKETGKWQDVSGAFGQPAGFAQIISDVPEPGTWAMLIFGLGAIGAAARSHRRRREASAA